MIKILDSENADLNLTSLVTVLTHTPSTSGPTLCKALIKFGDGAKNLDGTGGVTTDTGGPETDYTDAANDDYTLIAGAPGVGTGLWLKNDIGAYANRAAAAAGGVNGPFVSFNKGFE